MGRGDTDSRAAFNLLEDETCLCSELPASVVERFAVTRSYIVVLRELHAVSLDPITVAV